MTSPDDDYIPATTSDFLEWGWEPDLSQDCCRCGHTGSIYARLQITKKKRRRLFTYIELVRRIRRYP
jgi:hypothetical protein